MHNVRKVRELLLVQPAMNRDVKRRDGLSDIFDYIAGDLGPDIIVRDVVFGLILRDESLVQCKSACAVSPGNDVDRVLRALAYAFPVVVDVKDHILEVVDEAYRTIASSVSYRDRNKDSDMQILCFLVGRSVQEDLRTQTLSNIPQYLKSLEGFLSTALDYRYFRESPALHYGSFSQDIKQYFAEANGTSETRKCKRHFQEFIMSMLTKMRDRVAGPESSFVWSPDKTCVEKELCAEFVAKAFNSCLVEHRLRMLDIKDLF